MRNIDVTITIVNWNTREELEQSLASALVQDSEITHEVIVVDNDSRDGSPEMIRKKFPQVKLIANDKNVGFGKGQNQAIKASSGRYVMMMNPDSHFQETDSLAKMIRYMDEHPDVAALGPRILNTDGSLQYSARSFLDLTEAIAAGLFRHTVLGRLFPNNRYVKSYILADWKHDETREVGWLSGAALMLRKQAIEEIGFMDEGFFMYCEDVDWCYRAMKSGWKRIYYPQATVFHRIGASSDKAPVRMIYQFHKSMFRFFLKHHARGVKLLLAPAVLAGLTTRALGFIILTRAGAPGKTSKAGRQD